MKIFFSFLCGVFFGLALYQLKVSSMEYYTSNNLDIDEPQEVNVVNEKDVSELDFLADANATNASIELMSSINLERKNKKIGQLTTNSGLLCAAQFHAKDIGSRKTCSHYGKDGSTFQSRAKRCGFNLVTGGEIVACGYKSARTAVDGWIASPGHNRIIFNPLYKLFGCDMYNNYWVCVFSK